MIDAAQGRGVILRDRRVRKRVEAVVRGLMFAASAIAVLTTIGIVLSMVFEAMRFFALVGQRRIDIGFDILSIVIHFVSNAECIYDF